jgi:enhancing lycopene biosynthesis protein 2
MFFHSESPEPAEPVLSFLYALRTSGCFGCIKNQTAVRMQKSDGNCVNGEVLKLQQARSIVLSAIGIMCLGKSLILF